MEESDRTLHAAQVQMGNTRSVYAGPDEPDAGTTKPNGFLTSSSVFKETQVIVRTQAPDGTNRNQITTLMHSSESKEPQHPPTRKQTVEDPNGDSSCVFTGGGGGTSKRASSIPSASMVEIQILGSNTGP